MDILEKYYSALDHRAAEEHNKAMKANARGDEREHSIHLMCSSMLGDMLKVLGRVEHTRQRPGILQTQIDTLLREADKQKSIGDFDAADRTRIKAETIAWAMSVLKELEE